MTWPHRRNRPAPVRPVVATRIETIVCPYCLGRSQACCRCTSTGRVAYTRVSSLVVWAWDVLACTCATCEALRAQRLAIERGRDLRTAFALGR